MDWRICMSLCAFAAATACAPSRRGYPAAPSEVVERIALSPPVAPASREPTRELGPSDVPDAAPPASIEPALQEDDEVENAKPDLHPTPTLERGDAEIRLLLIEESRASYDGNCPCPEDRTVNGRRCGRLSAYVRKGGEAPLCYPADVTNDMVEEYRLRGAL